MNENDENKKSENEDAKFNYQYSVDVVDNDDEIRTLKSDKTFNLCLIAACLNFAFVVLFFMYNYKDAIKGVTYFGRKFVFSDSSVRFLMIFLILLVLLIAGFVFLFLYKKSKIMGIFGIILCAIVCFLCLLIQFLTVIVQFVLYIVAIILFLNNHIKSRVGFNQNSSDSG